MSGHSLTTRERNWLRDALVLLADNAEAYLASGIELNPEYAELCARRLQQQSLFAALAGTPSEDTG
jgi:hypothetical protein